jgi:O-antigen/teichoic acid export membrane protein
MNTTHKIARLPAIKKILEKPFVRNVSALTVGSIVSGICGLISTFVVVNAISKTEYAVYTTILMLAAFAGRVFDFRLNELIMIRLAKEKDTAVKKIIYCLGFTWIQMVISLLSGCILIAGSRTAGVFFFKCEVWTAAFTCGGFMLIGMSMYPLIESMYRYFGRFRIIALLMMISGAFRLGVIVYFKWAGRLGIYEVLIAEIGVQLIRVGGLYSFAGLKFFEAGLSFRSVSKLSMLRTISLILGEEKMFFWRSTFYGAASVKVKMLGNRIDSLILARFVIPEIVADYNLAKRLTGPLAVISRNVVSVLYPEIIRNIRNNRSTISAYIRKCAWGNAGLISFMCVCFVTTVWILFMLKMLPVSYKRASLILVIFCTSYCVYAWFVWLRPAAYALNMLPINFSFDAISVVGYLFALILLQHFFGISDWSLAILSSSFQLPAFLILSAVFFEKMKTGFQDSD